MGGSVNIARTIIDRGTKSGAVEGPENYCSSEYPHLGRRAIPHYRFTDPKVMRDFENKLDSH
jgi:hypothetical protein